ncbi:MAG: hypothetical protein FWE46_05500 [Coriobacteriia bacterium]|nr:hypothetical protein [Coriobacteriia bacterium]MCL2537470.1 hypothetical protein [Coriobacteriia bacterium]
MALTKEEKSLLELQDVDLKLAQLNAKAESAPQKKVIAATQSKITEGQRRLSIIEAARSDLEGKISELEAEVDEFAARMKETQSSMQKSTNHREIENLSKELEKLLKQKEKRENEGMKLMEKRSEFGLAQIDTADKVQQLQIALDSEMQSYKKYFGQLKKEHSELQAQRSGLVADLSAQTLQDYESIRAQKNGIGVALYSEGKCMGCQVLVPAAQRVDIESSNGLARCPSCKRLLVVDK